MVLGGKSVKMTCSFYHKPYHNIKGCPLKNPSSQTAEEGLDIHAPIYQRHEHVKKVNLAILFYITLYTKIFYFNPHPHVYI